MRIVGLSAILACMTAMCAAAPVTFSKDVAPILNQNCIECHRAGEAVPMALTSYEEARPWATSIRNMVSTRQMPPWHADPAIGTWKNDRSLTQSEIDTIVRWIDSGAPKGDPRELPPQPSFTKGWKIGTPDMEFTIPEQVLPASLEDEYRYVTVPTGFREDRWIEAAEVRPDNMDVVHHVIIFTAKPEQLARGDGLGGGLGGYAPGSQPLRAPEGRGLLVEAGSLLVLQMHYHKEPGSEERDATRIGIRFADHEIDKQIRFGEVGTTNFVIPPGAADHVVSATTTLDTEIRMEQIIPHMHLRGQSMRVWAELPNGSRRDLINVPKYDFNWQTFYEFAEPVALPRGTVLHARAHYDNSANNPFNPNPNREVRFGLPTTAEMMFAFYIYTKDDEELNTYDPSTTGGDS